VDIKKNVTGIRHDFLLPYARGTNKVVPKKKMWIVP